MNLPACAAALHPWVSALQNQHPNSLSPHAAFGALVGLLSLPASPQRATLLDIILDDNVEQDAYNALLDAPNPAIADWDGFCQTLRATLLDAPQALAQFYAPLDGCISEGLAQWCDGYIQAYLALEEHWQEFFEVLKAGDAEGDLSEWLENHEVLLNMLDALSDWQDALENNADLAALENGPATICEEAFEGVQQFLQLGSAVGEEVQMDATPPQAPFVNPIKIGRNDPCFCGSGKKYKACCLN